MQIIRVIILKFSIKNIFIFAKIGKLESQSLATIDFSFKNIFYS